MREETNLVTLEQTRDIDLVRAIMTDKDIWSKIGSDIVEREQFIPLLSEKMICLVVKTDKPIGLSQFTLEEHGVYFHPMILKPYRRLAREAISQSIDWYFKHIGNFLMCEIPVTQQSTINLAYKMGAKDFGINEGAIMINGKRIDLQVLRLAK